MAASIHLATPKGALINFSPPTNNFLGKAPVLTNPPPTLQTLAKRMGLPHASTTYYAHPPFARVCMIVRSWMINPLNVSDHLPVAARLRMSPTVARPHRIPRGEPDRPNWKHCSRKQLPQCSESLIA